MSTQVCSTSAVAVARLDQREVKRLLLMAANGTTKLGRIHVLVCVCGATADIRENPEAWNGWRVAPLLDCMCPVCLERTETNETTDSCQYPRQARESYIKQVKATGGKHG